MTQEQLIALAERCEHLTMESWGEIGRLNQDIHEAAPGEVKTIVPPDYCRSIDAALTLVPDGMGFKLERYWIESVDGPVWSCAIITGGLPDKPRQVFETYDVPTPALAICAAALKARGEG